MGMGTGSAGGGKVGGPIEYTPLLYIGKVE